MLTPEETIAKNEAGASLKAGSDFKTLLLKGIFAGSAIAFGAAASSTVAFAIDNVGLSRLVQGIVFPVGLMLIVMLGGELFTGDTLMAMGVFGKKITIGQYIRTLVIVYFSNFIGSLLIAFLMKFSGNFNLGGGNLGTFVAGIAEKKSQIGPVAGICSGILCNILVCLAVLMAQSAVNVIGKIFAVWFPIMAFVVCGFEHVVANMYYIPAGLLAGANATIPGCLLNYLWVTIGNVIGGLFVAFLLWNAHRRKTV